MQSTALSRPKKSTNVRFLQLALQATFRALGATSTPLAALLADRLWSTPPRAPLRPEQRAVLGEAERLAADAGDMRIAVYAWGSGPAVLLVHGWGGHAGQLAPLVAPLRARGLRVLALDAPGHGATRGGAPHLVAFAQAIAAVDRLAGGLHGVVAHSLGATAAAFAMREHPVRPERAVFLAPAADMTEASRRFARLLAVPGAARDEMQRRFERRLGVSWDRLRVPSIAAEMAARLLVIHDENDPEVPASEGAAIAAAWPGASYVRTEGLGHHRIVRDADVIDRAAAFLAA